MISFLRSAALAALMVLPGVTWAEEPAHPDLSGTWVLNVRASDDPATVMRQAGGGRGQSGGSSQMGGMKGGRGGGGGGGGGRGGMGGGHEGRSAQDPAAGRAGAQIMQRLQKLVIFHEGDELDITDGLDISRLLRTDGRPTTVWTERGQVKATATWQNNHLEVHWRGGGADRTSRYSISADGSQFTALEEIVRPGQDKGVVLRLVYDRVVADTPPK